MTDKDTVLSLEQTLRLALEALEEYCEHGAIFMPITARDAVKTALLSQSDGEAKDEPVGLIESLKDAKPCCGQYETCWRACTPRGKFIGQRDAQRKPLTDEEIQDALEAEFLGCDAKRNWQDDLRVARAIEAAHGIIDPTDLKGKHDA